jgi:hypothetical protein
MRIATHIYIHYGWIVTQRGVIQPETPSQLYIERVLLKIIKKRDRRREIKFE